MTRRLTRPLPHSIPRLAAALCGLACLLAAAAPAEAGDWMFRRSYYTHDLPPEVARHYPQPQSRSAYRPAIAGNTPGLSIRGGYRFNRIFLSGPAATDITIYREDWYELEP